MIRETKQPRELSEEEFRTLACAPAGKIERGDSATDAFVRCVLDDNVRLRAEIEALRTELRTARAEGDQAALRNLARIYRIVKAVGGDITVPASDHGAYDSRRLFIEGGDFGDSTRYRLVSDSEAAFGAVVVDPKQVSLT